LVNQTQILSVVGADAATGNPTYRLNQVNNLLPTATFRDNINISSTWSMQVGLRYIFN
jgi:hypothetical protein